MRVSTELKKRGLSISPFGARGAWLRHDLATTKKRLKALEAKMAQEGLALTEAQLAALDKAKSQKESRGEFESECPGYCGAQDTFYVGNMKGVWPHLPADLHRHLQQGAFAKLYDRKTPITAAEILNDRVLPFFEQHGVALSRVLTDRGAEYCGNPKHHEYELYLAIEDRRPHAHENEKPTDERNLLEVPQDRARRVLSCGIPKEALPLDRRVAGRPRSLADGI